MKNEDHALTRKLIGYEMTKLLLAPDSHWIFKTGLRVKQLISELFQIRIDKFNFTWFHFKSNKIHIDFWKQNNFSQFWYQAFWSVTEEDAMKTVFRIPLNPSQMRRQFFSAFFILYRQVRGTHVIHTYMHES